MESEKNWEQLATQKRDSILAAIPKEWHLENIPTPEEQRDVSGTYIDQFLSSQEKEITETDAVGIVEKTTTGQWKAVDVCRSFCHRASIAHQLVCFLWNDCEDEAKTKANKAQRSTASMRSSSTLHSKLPKLWTPTMPNTRSPSVHYMAFLSV